MIVPWNNCPRVAFEETELQANDCECSPNGWFLQPLAHIPVDGSSLTIFHNPFAPLNCVTFEFYCRKEWGLFGDLLFFAQQEIKRICQPYNFIFNKNKNLWRADMATNPEAEVCRKVKKWLWLDVFIIRDKEFIFMYGCRKKDANLPPSVGAWVLVSLNATEKQRRRVWGEVQLLTAKIPGFKDEWWFTPDEGKPCLQNRTCDYLVNCQTTSEGDEVFVPLLTNNLRNVYMILVPVGLFVLLLTCYLVFKLDPVSTYTLQLDLRKEPDPVRDGNNRLLMMYKETKNSTAERHWMVQFFPDVFFADFPSVRPLRSVPSTFGESSSSNRLKTEPIT
uniref:Uncharacterized protein n=1 Tax=Anopheles farauti TaxID=69004 RepID=A0A182QJB1_9DIPT